MARLFDSDRLYDIVHDDVSRLDTIDSICSNAKTHFVDWSWDPTSAKYYVEYSQRDVFRKLVERCEIIKKASGKSNDDLFYIVDANVQLLTAECEYQGRDLDDCQLDDYKKLLDLECVSGAYPYPHHYRFTWDEPIPR
jgi:hypothetical protein